MTTLTTRTVANTYKDLLQVSNSNAGIDTTLRNIEDGEGTQAPLKLSSTAIEIGRYQEGLTVANTGTAYTIALTDGNNFRLTLTGNCTFTFPSSLDNNKAISISLIVIQDATGGRSLTYPASVKWPGGVPTLTTTANAVAILTFYTTDDGTTWYGNLVGDNYA